MISQYQTTGQGKQTRSLLVSYLEQYPQQEFSREELVEHCDLTYDQVRRQTKNLCIEGVIQSRIGTNGRRVYCLRGSFTQKIGVIAIVLIAAWSVQVEPNIKWNHRDAFSYFEISAQVA